jgi:beta-hydroxylase
MFCSTRRPPASWSALTLPHPFVPVLQSHSSAIRRELAALDLERDFVDWPERAAYAGSWRLFPLYFPAAPYLPVDAARNRARCPETARVLASIHTLEGAGFSMLGARSRIHAHRDHYAPGVVRCHLALSVPPGCSMQIAGRSLSWEEGKCLVFDGQVEHEAVNPSAQPRIVLLADFRTESGAPAGVCNRS